MRGEPWWESAAIDRVIECRSGPARLLDGRCLTAHANKAWVPPITAKLPVGAGLGAPNGAMPLLIPVITTAPTDDPSAETDAAWGINIAGHAVAPIFGKLEVMSEAREPLIEDFRLDRSHFSVARLTDPDDATQYWLSRPVEERLRALELLRRTFYGHASASEGLQRVLEVAQLERG